MLHVILIILKILGITIAVVCGVLLLLFFLILFVPVRYKAYLYKQEKILVNAKISWMFPLICIPISYKDNLFSAKGKLFGIFIKDFTKKKQQKSTSNKEETARPVEPKPISHKTEPDPPEKQQSEVGLKQQSAYKKNRNLKYTIRNFYDKIKETLNNISDIKNLLLEEPSKAALSLIFGQFYFLIQKLLPSKLRGEVRFGTDDPALTGEILGGISIVYPFIMQNVTIIPDFENQGLEGELFVRGKLHVITFVRIAWKIYRDKNIRNVYTKIRTRTNNVTNL